MALGTRGFIILAVVVAACFVSGRATSGAAEPRSSATSKAEEAVAPAATGDNADTAHRQREGTRIIKQEGHFRATGDRLTFQLRDSDRKYAGLENLAMERIGKVMSDRHDHPERLLWEISGVFTEYRGTNYLLITHAILKNKSRQRSNLP